MFPEVVGCPVRVIAPPSVTVAGVAVNVTVGAAWIVTVANAAALCTPRLSVTISENFTCPVVLGTVTSTLEAVPDTDGLAVVSGVGVAVAAGAVAAVVAAACVVAVAVAGEVVVVAAASVVAGVVVVLGVVGICLTPL